MAQTPAITLRYFEARGRAQPIRYYFAARGIAYTDERVPLPSSGKNVWLELKEDRSRVGPFHKLPVLRYGDRTVAETLVIGAFLHRALGDEALLSDEDNLRHSMLISSLYGDVVTPIATMLWAEAIYVGLDDQISRLLPGRRRHVLRDRKTLPDNIEQMPRRRTGSKLSLQMHSQHFVGAHRA